MMKKKTHSKKEITNEDLALMVVRGFDNVNSEMKKGFYDVRSEMKKGFDDVWFEFEKVHNHIEKVEGHHGRRLEHLEDRDRIINTVLEKDLKIKVPR